MNSNLFEQVNQYISGLLGEENEALQSTTQTINAAGISNASISPNQGKFLQVLALACNAKRILELGTLGAYSTIWLANAIPNDGKVITIESDPSHFELAKSNIQVAGLSSKIEIRLGNALNQLQLLEQEHQAPFDMIFIDADKPPYTEYFQWAIKLGRPGSIIVADNVIRNGNVLNENSQDDKVKGVQRLNKMLQNCQEVTATILQTVGVKEYDGMVVAVVNRKNN